MLIADAQVHIWAPSTPERPWRAGQAMHRETPLGADELLREMDAAGVHRAVLVPPYWDYDRNDLVLEAAQRHPDRFAAMGRLDTATPGARELVATWRRQPGMLGLRCSFNRPHLIATLTEGRADWLWEEAEKAGVPIMALVSHDRVHLIDRFAERHPRLKLALCHLGLTSNEYDEVAFRDLDRLLALARRPNVNVKLSALPAYTKDTYPYRSLHPYLRRVYDAFGPRRMFWGTDLARLPCSYRQAITMFTEAIPWLTAADQEWIMGRGLCEWLEWPLPRDRG
ncbi:MAG: amidohydrolase [Betaproteobacteria bacterium]|nr:amidohydrolase [Betaproteobacteria bacterium]MDH3436342.1 amidohydrolase [Betaproteobacteria bacterium]